METKNYYAIIMAGGVGSRFWPVSTRKYPKQFQDMFGTGESLIQKTFRRLQTFIPKENIYILTNKNYKNLVYEHLEGIGEEQVVLEPAMRNTAPCILYASLKIQKKNPDAVTIVAPSDHWIENETAFVHTVKKAFQACSEQKNMLMTLGVPALTPNTGYGYIHYDKEDKSTIKKVVKFTEKPDLETAKQFIASGDYLWNAGIFVWSVHGILSAFKDFLPQMYVLLEAGYRSYNTIDEIRFIAETYAKAENISIDNGIAEKSANVYVLPVDFDWNDLGTWGSLYDKLEKDKTGNASVGAIPLFRNADGNMIRTTEGKLVVIQGLSNFIVVENKDVLLICPKKDEQDIKQIVADVAQKYSEEKV